jgi:hydrogenase/urease accessory protein HupE
MNPWLLALACLLLANVASAHPGHGVAPASSWLHGLAPVHLAPVVLAAVALGFAVRALRSRRVADRERRR